MWIKDLHKLQDIVKLEYMIFNGVIRNMPQQYYEVSGRTFRTKQDYIYAKKDELLIAQIRQKTDFDNISQLEKLLTDLDGSMYSFMTLLGEDFTEEVEERIRYLKENPPQVKKRGILSSSKKADSKKKSKEKSPRQPDRDAKQLQDYDSAMQVRILSELKKQERKRRLLIAILSVLATACMAYVGFYYYQYEKNGMDYDKLSQIKEDSSKDPKKGYTVTVAEQKDAPPILAKYETLYKKNKKLIGWLKIDDTNIDYPVMQTVNNEYYLDHNFNQEYDKNGSLFLDKDCNAAFPNTNMIIYGHHMKSGKMFGNLNYYSKESYYKEHPQIRFDTIYEEGIYDIMYVFRSRIYNEEEIVFKYYQFMDVNSADEFYSAMDEMARMSLYDTGVSADFGDKLITLSTCDSSETDGRFVVVAKKVNQNIQ